MSNQKLAIKLFSQKPTYQVLKMEKEHREHKSRVQRMSRIMK